MRRHHREPAVREVTAEEARQQLRARGIECRQRFVQDPQRARNEREAREPDAPAKLYYEVTRRGDDGSERLIWGGLGRRLTDRPGPGTWTYRVEVVPSFHPTGIPPARVFALSRPVRIAVAS